MQSAKQLQEAASNIIGSNGLIYDPNQLQSEEMKKKFLAKQ